MRVARRRHGAADALHAALGVHKSAVIERDHAAVPHARADGREFLESKRRIEQPRRDDARERAADDHALHAPSRSPPPISSTMRRTGMPNSISYNPGRTNSELSDTTLVPRLLENPSVRYASPPRSTILDFDYSGPPKPKEPNALMHYLKMAFNKPYFHIVRSGWV